jgi:hypothetical protein
MNKFLALVALLIVLLASLTGLIWMNRASVASHFISKQLHAPVAMDKLDITKNQATLSNFWIGNPPGFKTKTAFASDTIQIDATYRELTGDVLTINQIELSQIFVGVEMYKGKDNNWSRIAKKDAEPTKKGRDYLIRTLILNNLTVRMTQADGSVKTYPTIPRMVFYNISSQTGFPISEIEKAIFNLIIQDLFKKLNLDLLDTLNPTSIPIAPALKALPGLFGG